jgi:hypothetical protein
MGLKIAIADRLFPLQAVNVAVVAEAVDAAVAKRAVQDLKTHRQNNFRIRE